MTISMSRAVESLRTVVETLLSENPTVIEALRVTSTSLYNSLLEKVEGGGSGKRRVKGTKQGAQVHAGGTCFSGRFSGPSRRFGTMY